MKIDTKCVHSGGVADTISGGVNTPIFPSSAHEYLDEDLQPYPRYFNTANQEGIVEKLRQLEKAEDGVVFSSGMAAISSTLLAFLNAGDHAVIQEEIYGGSHAFADDYLKRFGISVSFVSTDSETVEKAIRPETRLIYIETPTNPLLSLTDIAETVKIAGRNNCLTVIDNTFATPINQTPIELGVDISLHSGSKYLGGHSDLCCGAALGASELIERVRNTASVLGGSLNPLSCYLLERSLKTLYIRVKRQTENASQIAEFLSGRPDIKRVNYPGLKSHPGHSIAVRQMKGFGAMLSFETKERTAYDFMKKLKLIKPALSLGGIETTICDPAGTSHLKLSPEDRARVGISDNLLRLSAGAENAEDLMEDIQRALE